MRWPLLAVGGLMLLAAGCRACNHSRRPGQATRPLFVADEILVRISGPSPPPGTEHAILSKLEEHFDAPRDTCCPGEAHPTYRFGIGSRSVDQAIREARELDSVRIWAQPNFLYAQDKTPNEDAFKSQWSLHDPGRDADINAPEAWDEVTGDSRVAIAIVDSGVRYTNDDLVDRVWRNEAECPGSITGTAGVDDDQNGYIDDCYGIDAVQAANAGNGQVASANAGANDHGTGVAGIAAAQANNDKLMAGVVWDSRIVICKFFEGALDGTSQDLRRCLHYILDLKRRHPSDLQHLVAVNMSWGTSEYDNLLYCEIDALRREGVLAVASAGNDGTDNDSIPHYPSRYFLPNVIAVAETGIDETGKTEILLNNSNRGARTVHTAAPGEVLSLGFGDLLKAFGGTSAAAPHVTGLIALLEAKGLQGGGDDFDWRALRNLVLAGGRPLPDLNQTVTSGRPIRACDPAPSTPSTTAAPQGTPQDAPQDTATPCLGSLTCRHQLVRRRLRPLENDVGAGKKRLSVKPGTSLLLAAISIDCAAPAGPVQVVAVASTGSTTTTIIPLDDGNLDHDQADGDGIFTADWTPPTDVSDFVLKYRYGTSATEIADDEVTVHVASDAPPGDPQQTTTCPQQADSLQQ